MAREPFAKCMGRMREHRAATDAVCDALESMSDGMACFFPCSKDDDLTLEALAASLSDDPHAQEAIAGGMSRLCCDWSFGEGAGPGGRAATADGLYLTEGGESPLIYFGGAAEGTRHELWVDGRGLSFGIPRGKMVRTGRVDVVRRLLGYTDGLSRGETLGMLGEAEGLSYDGGMD